MISVSRSGEVMGLQSNHDFSIKVMRLQSHAHTDAHKVSDEYCIVAFCKNATIKSGVFQVLKSANKSRFITQKHDKIWS